MEEVLGSIITKVPLGPLILWAEISGRLSRSCGQSTHYSRQTHGGRQDLVHPLGPVRPGKAAGQLDRPPPKLPKGIVTGILAFDQFDEFA